MDHELSSELSASWLHVLWSRKVRVVVRVWGRRWSSAVCVHRFIFFVIVILLNIILKVLEGWGLSVFLEGAFVAETAQENNVSCDTFRCIEGSYEVAP